MTLPATNTLLVLSGMGQPLYAARGLTQTLKPIGAASQISRSINGVYMDLSYGQFRQYQSEITCTDMEAPSFDGFWPGGIVTVDCVVELSYVTSGGSPTRAVVEGSEREDGEITFYRPRLEMVMVDFDNAIDEYNAEYSWRLTLEETEPFVGST